jgi:hypothetical protein
MAGVQIQIPTEHLTDSSLGRYRHANLFCVELNALHLVPQLMMLMVVPGGHAVA